MTEARLDEQGRLFFENLFQPHRRDWYCRMSMQEMRQNGIPVSHTSMEGTQHMRRPGTAQGMELIHAGLLSVPSTRENNQRFLRTMADALDAGARLYLSEVATHVHPVYIDFDADMDLKDVSVLRLMHDVIAKANLQTFSEVPLESSPILHEFMNMASPMDIAFDNDLIIAMRDTFKERSWTWLDVLKMCIVLKQKNPRFVVDTRLVRPFFTFFIMAIGKLVQQVLQTFYADAENDAKFMMVILGNQGPTAYKPDPDTGTYKVGAHFHVRAILVNRDIELYMREAIVHMFTETFPAGPYTADAAGAYWRKVFDISVYTRGFTAGLRMPFCHKAEMCAGCKGRGRNCTVCKDIHRFDVNRYYGPVAMLKPNGNVDDTEKLLNLFFKTRYFVLNLCSIRIEENVRVTQGVLLDGKPKPVDARDTRELHLVALKDYVGSNKKADLRVSQLRRNYAVNGDEIRLTHLLEAEVTFLDVFGTEKIPDRRRQYLTPTDARFRAVAAYVPYFCAELFSPVYKNMQVTGVTLIEEKVDRSFMYVHVRGPGASHCFNRVNTAGGEGPGEHSHWPNTVYFRVDRFTRQITQLCANTNRKTGEHRVNAGRNSDGTLQTCSCKDWTGASRTLQPRPRSTIAETTSTEAAAERQRYEQFIRDMFYLPEEQTADHSRMATVEKYKVLLTMCRKRKDAQTPVGNDPTYNRHLQSLLDANMQSKRPKRATATTTFVPPSDVDPDSGLPDSMIYK